MQVFIGGIKVVACNSEKPIFYPEHKLLTIPNNWVDTIWIMNFQQLLDAIRTYGDDIELLAYNHLNDIYIVHGKTDLKDGFIALLEIRIEGDKYGCG